MRSWNEYKKTMVQEANMWTAAKDNDVWQIASLVQKGAEVDEKDHRGYSPLMLAVYAGNLEASKALLMLGADPNSTDLGGNSILMGACFKGHLELVRLLLNAHADPSVRNPSKLTAHDFAVAFGRREVAEHLQAWGVKEREGSRINSLVRLAWGRMWQKTARTQKPG